MVHSRGITGDLFAEPALCCRLLGNVVEGVGENETCKIYISDTVQQLGDISTYRGLPWKKLYIYGLSTSSAFEGMILTHVVE